MVLNGTKDEDKSPKDVPREVITAAIIITLILGIAVAAILTALLVLSRRKCGPWKQSSMNVSTPGHDNINNNNDDDRSHASTCQISDAEHEPSRPLNNFILRNYLSSLNINGVPPTANTHQLTVNGATYEQYPLRDHRGSSEPRTHNTAVSHCSSLFKKPLEPRADYPASSDMEFVGCIQVVDCDAQGGEYHNKEHLIKIRIQRNPFHADDTNRQSLELEIGIAVHGHVRFPEDWIPVSPILWLNVAENFSYEFGKSIEVEMPHYLQLSAAEISSLSSSEQLGWMYAYCDPEEPRLAPMELIRGDPRSFCFMQCNGKILTRRGCYMCLCATKAVVKSHSTYCLVTAVEKPLTSSPELTIFFFVCYHLNSFIEVRQTHPLFIS